MKNLLISALLLATPAAFADSNDAAEYAYQLSQAKITMTDALSLAETEAKGTAVSADLDSSRGKVIYDVDVLAGQKLFEVRINAVDGSIVFVREDRGN